MPTWSPKEVRILTEWGVAYTKDHPGIHCSDLIEPMRDRSFLFPDNLEEESELIVIAHSIYERRNEWSLDISCDCPEYPEWDSDEDPSSDSDESDNDPESAQA